MTETHKRRAWFQLHLSTCVVLMVIAASILYFNLVVVGGKISMTIAGDEIDLGTLDYSGWPIQHCTAYENPDGKVVSWHYGYLSLNVLAWLSILAASGIACESLIRRRARKRAA